MKTYTLQLIDDQTNQVVVSHCQIGEDSLDAIKRFAKDMTIAGEKEANFERVSTEPAGQQSTTFKSR